MASLKQYFNFLRNVLSEDVDEVNEIFRNYPALPKSIFTAFKKFYNYFQCPNTVYCTVIIDTFTQLVFVMANMAIIPEYKVSILDASIIEGVKYCTLIDHSGLRVALVWLLLNLSWKEDPDYLNCIAMLNIYDFKGWLQHLKSKYHFLEDKVETALKNFE